VRLPNNVSDMLKTTQGLYTYCQNIDIKISMTSAVVLVSFFFLNRIFVIIFTVGSLSIVKWRQDWKRIRLMSIIRLKLYGKLTTSYIL
jgi:hypothetical protein